MAEALKRRIGLGLLTAYGVGVMVGAGIYVIVGAVAGAAGVWAPLAFLLAGLVALPSALSYSEFTTRLPEAAGEAVFIEAGFNSRWLAVVVGLAIVTAGTVSAATVLRGGVGYLYDIMPISQVTLTLVLGVALISVAIIGVLESMLLVAVFTVAEVLGLAIVVWAGFMAAPVEAIITPPPPHWAGIASAIALCFFAFIGFEDIVNMAEEVENPERTMPRAILLSLAITATLYALVSYAAVRSVPADLLSASEQPLTLVWETSQGSSAKFLSAIAVAAAVNGVLAQIIMASRVLFGLGRRSPALAIFTHVHPRFGTPIRATLLVGSLVVLGAITLPIVSLAKLTSGILLSVFLMVNIALILLKRKSPEAPFRVAIWVPWVGILVTLAALVATLGDVI